MILLIRFLVWLGSLVRPTPPCLHLRYHERRWLDAQTGTPWASFRCKDCGHSSYGHVHGDSDGWEGETST